MDEDKSRRHVNIAIIAACGTIMIYMILAMWLRGGASYAKWYDFLFAFIFGALMGAGGYGAATTLDL
jgi:hypothetical protein